LLRLSLTPIAIVGGLVAGFLAWLAGGGPSAADARLGPIEDQVAALRAPSMTVAPARAVDVAALTAEPIFFLTTGPGAVPPPALRLDGLVRSRTRIAGLLSINDHPAEWMMLGETRDGITLQAVGNSKVVVDTIYGPVEIGLGQRLGNDPASPTSGPTPPASPTPPSAALSAPNPPLTPAPQLDGIPPGFRRPPPPASAPRRP